MAEFPVVLSVFLLVVLFPLVDLGTLAFGASSIHNAARVAVVDAARAPTFAAATSVAKSAASGLSTGGVTITADSVQVTAQRVPFDSEATDTSGSVEPIPITPPSTEPIDTKANLYQIKVTVTGQVRPLVTLTDSFGNVPGLTGPLVVTASSTATYENPKALGP